MTAGVGAWSSLTAHGRACVFGGHLQTVSVGVGLPREFADLSGPAEV
jgi:hypothetical protein